MVERLSYTSQVKMHRHHTGETLGDCHLKGLLHDDGISEIHKAIDVHDEHECVVKCFGVKLNVHDVEVVNDIIEHEKRLQRYHELGCVTRVEEASSPFDTIVVCPVAFGKTLAEVMRDEGIFQETRCLDITRGIVSKLSPFEKAGLGHGSLTMDGVRCDKNGNIALTSCGFAGLTGCYASPEARLGQFDVVSDFFSVGVIMYVMLTGCEPFGNAGKMTPLWEVRPDLPSDIILLVHHLMSENRLERPSGTRELLSLLDAIDLERHLPLDVIQEEVLGYGISSGGRRKVRMKAISAEVGGRQLKSGGSWIMKAAGLAIFLFAFVVGYGLATNGQDDWRQFFEKTVLKKFSVRNVAVAEAVPQNSEMKTGGENAVLESEVDEHKEDAVAAEVVSHRMEGPDEAEEEVAVAMEGEAAEPSEKKEAVITEKVVVDADATEEKDGATDKNDEEAPRRQKQLEEALKRRDAKEIKKLLSAGAKLDWVSEDGTSLMQQACARGHWDVVEFMLRQGADPNWRPKVMGEKFKLPLQIALDNGKKFHGGLLMLLKYKADPEMLFDTVLFFTARPEDNGRLARNNLAGIVAMCQYGYLRENRPLQLEVVNAWLEANKGDLTDEIMANVLAAAIDQKMAKGFLKALLQRVKSMKPAPFGRVLLAAMKHKNRIELMGRLKALGINVNGVCEMEKDGVVLRETPLYYAVRQKFDEEVVRWLLANGASVKWANEDGKTVMDLDMSPKIRQLLLEAKQGKVVTQEWNENLYTTGTTTIRPNMPWDADLNAVTVKGEHADWITAEHAKDQKLVDGNVDFYWKYDIENKKLTLEPRNGCEVWPMTGNLTPFQQISVSYIVKQKFSEMTLEYTKEEGCPLRGGAVVLFRTSKGNYGKFRVERYEDEVIDKKKRRNVAIKIHWFVYHLREEDVRESHTKRTIW